MLNVEILARLQSACQIPLGTTFAVVWLAKADLYPNEVSGIENGITHNDIEVTTFSISPLPYH